MENKTLKKANPEIRTSNVAQREYLRSGGNLELRPVHDTKRNKDNKTLNHTSTPPGANILLCGRAYSFIRLITSVPNSLNVALKISIL